MNERIERLINESAMSDNDKAEVKELFERLWYQYYIGGMDTHFVDRDLKVFWLMYKILMLTDMTAYHDKKAINMLTKEVNANANIFINAEHTIKEFL